MLKAHVDAVEESLLAVSKIPANSGHSLHKGTPREAFIRKFLQGHLSERVAVGTGEIIDGNSRPGEQRNQIDIVIYKREYPRLDFGGEINGFLAESVVATIEVKSSLDKEGLAKAARAAKAIKRLTRNVVTSFTAGYQPPSILSYVVAYDGPASMETVFGWFPDVNAAEGIVYPDLPVSGAERQRTSSPSLDAIFVLGRGFVHFGNTPVGFFQSKCLEQNGGAKWAIADAPRGSLLLLFLFLTSAVSGMAGAWLDPMPYLRSFCVEKCVIGE
ncbi:MAG: hypothetical protein NTW96_22565 [Planctomycetia bacterium]|nr:hypothetical protein [Planctomycetia bacterium]